MKKVAIIVGQQQMEDFNICIVQSIFGICFLLVIQFIVAKFYIQELYENFLHERFCNRLKYSNRAVNFANHTKYFYTNCMNK